MWPTIPNSVTHVLMRNTDLETFSLPDTPNLVELNLSGSKKLKSVNLNSPKKLATLSLSGCPVTSLRGNVPSLTDLSLASTPIEKLDITNAIKLSKLNLNSTPIKSLDLRGFPELSSLSLNSCKSLGEGVSPIIFGGSNSCKLVSLDVSKCEIDSVDIASIFNGLSSSAKTDIIANKSLTYIGNAKRPPSADSAYKNLKKYAWKFNPEDPALEDYTKVSAGSETAEFTKDDLFKSRKIFVLLIMPLLCPLMLLIRYPYYV